MPSDAAELSSLSTALTELEDRVVAMAARRDATRDADLVTALHEAERQLRAARRSLERAQRLAP